MSEKENQKIIRKQFTLNEISNGIQNLNRMIQKVENLKPQKVKYDSQEKINVEFQIVETIRELFGDLSPEFEKYHYHKIGYGCIAPWASDYEQQKFFEEGIPQTIIMLKGLIEWLEQKKPYAESGKNYWNFVNPIWLIWQVILKITLLLKYGWKHKIISGIIIVLFTLLVTDYTMAWRNLQWIVNFFRNIR